MSRIHSQPTAGDCMSKVIIPPWVGLSDHRQQDAAKYLRRGVEMRRNFCLAAAAAAA